MKEVVKEYSNDALVIVWDHGKCKHAAQCVKHSPNVFDTEKRPWIDANGSNSKEIMATIDRCPSGALTYRDK